MLDRHNSSVQKLDNFHERLNLEDELKHDVYHFTNFHNVLSILKELKIFLTEHKYFISEANHLIEILKRIIPERKLPRKIVYRGIKFTGFWEFLEWYINHKINCFRACFYLGEENDDKHMWNSFGGSKNEVKAAIKFSKSYFDLKPITSKPILVRSKISYESYKTKNSKIDEFAQIIKGILDNLDIKNQEDSLLDTYSHIISCIPKFLTDETDLELEKEYRIFAIDDGYNSDLKLPIFKLNGKDGTFTDEIPLEYIKEIVIDSSCQNFEQKKKEILEVLNQRFSANQFSHLLIKQSQI